MTTAHDLYYAEPTPEPILLDQETVGDVISLLSYGATLTPTQQMIYDLSGDDAHKCQSCDRFVGLSLSGERDEIASWFPFYVTNADGDEFTCVTCFEEIEAVTARQEASCFPEEEI